MRRASAGALLTLAALATACPSPTPPATPAPAGTAAAASRTAPHPRLITSAPALAELVCALGAREHLIGVSRFCTHPPELRELPQVGGAIDPNLEVIDALAPDLVLLQGRHGPLEELAELRPWSIERFRIERTADVFTALERLGVLLARPQQAAAERTRLEQALAAARAERPARPPRTLLVLGRTAGALTGLTCPAEETFLSECLESAGGTNCLSGLRGYPLISTELLVERAPELIVELYPSPLGAAERDALRADWSRLSGLPAVAQGRIAIVTGEALLQPGPRLDETLRLLGRALGGERDVE